MSEEQATRAIELQLDRDLEAGITRVGITIGRGYRVSTIRLMHPDPDGAPYHSLVTLECASHEGPVGTEVDERAYDSLDDAFEGHEQLSVTYCQPWWRKWLRVADV